MSSQRVKILIGIVVAILAIAGLGSLVRDTTRDRDKDATGSEETDADSRRTRSGRFGATSGGAVKEASADKSKSGRDKKANPDDRPTSAPTIADSSTTNALGETEAETRERERYEAAQRNAFKYRKLDPNKIKPVELGPAFEEASKKYNIPKDLLAALAYVESGGTHRDGDHSIEAGYGVMNLKENNLVDTAAEAASLLGKSKEELLYDQKLNVLGSAALLSKYYEDALAAGVSESEAWYIAVSTYSGRPNQELAAAHADEVAGWLIKGFQADVNDGGGSFGVTPNPTNPLFLPKNWKLVGLNPPTKPGEAPTLIDPEGSKVPSN